MRVSEALRLFDFAEQANYDPDVCAAGRWICHMLSGNFELAWRESDAITARAKPDPNRFWDGRAFHNRSVLVRCLHGLGDTIQFVRYLPLLRKKARTVSIEVQPELKLLLQESHIADEVFTWGEPEPHWDQQIEVVELPRVFRTTLGSVPNQVPYLGLSACPPVVGNHARDLRVGIVWTSSSFNPARSIPLEQLVPIFATPDVRFYSLQAGSERSQLATCAVEVISLYDETACVLATAKAVNTLDLLISVDTMVAHLAGALARPVWTLLPYECDWRWMLAREDSPWYPTMRLFRQPKPSDWDPVIERVQSELRALVSTRTRAMDSGTTLRATPPLVREV